MTDLKRHLSFANLLSCLALFIALSGVAYAATLGKNAVKARNIARGAVTTPKLKNGAVTASKLRNGAVIGSKIANGAVGASKLANASVRSSALGGGVVTTAKLKSLAVTEEKLGNNSVGTAKLNADAVATGKIQDGAVTGVKLASSFYAQLAKNVSYADAESFSNNDDAKTVTADCPSGKEVTGGGARIEGAGDKVVISESAPKVNGDDSRTGWTASAREVEAETESWSIIAFAICAEL
jgi:hypothetical protein